MARAISPLRYPGGKTCLYPLVSRLLNANGLARRHYVEPFAGGCGLGLALLYGGYVSDVHINDLDPSIWAFWHSVLNHCGEFQHLIAVTPVTVEEWQHQREVYLAQDCSDPLALGFSTFFLNRTNRSGIIKGAGVIGGLDQDGPYKIDCRFNRDGLIRRVGRIAKYRTRIHLTGKDAVEFIGEALARLPESAFFCVDPPYVNKGSELYRSYYDSSDHAVLAERVLQMDNPWIVTYDKDPVVASLYERRRQFEFDVNYSLETKRRGTELLILSKGLRVPREIRQRQSRRRQSRAA